MLALTVGVAAHAQDAQPTGGQLPAQAASAPPRTVPENGPTQAEVPSPASTSSTVGEVVITAERRAVNIQTTAISMTAESGAQLQEKQVVTIGDLQTQTPGFSFTNSGQTSNINIRGLGNSAITPSITTGVAVFRDGLYEPEAILLNEPFYDIADAEVLRGPQGTIVGQNSTGGALLINSRNPDMNGINGYVEGVVGNYSERRGSGAINLPIIPDVLAARVAFNVENRDSFYTDRGQALNGTKGSSPDISNDHPGRIDENNFRIGVLYRPNASFQALFKAELNYLDTGGIVGKPLPPPTCNIPNSACTRGNYSQFGYLPNALNNFTTPDDYDLFYNHQEEQIDRADRFSLELKYTLPNGITLRSLTGYQHLDEQLEQDTDKSFTTPAAEAASGSPLIGHYNFHEVGPLDDYYSQEFNILSPTTGKFTWLAGASYFYRSTPVNLVEYPDVNGVSPNPQMVGADSITHLTGIQRLFGVFGQVTYQVLPTVQIQAGVRYSIDNNQQGGYVVPSANGIVNIGRHVSLAGIYSDSTPTGKIAINWTPVPGQFFYAFYTRGFKSGGVNGAGAPNFDPEYIDDYEAGWKGRLFDNHIQTQVGGYYIDYQQLQYQTLLTSTGGNRIINLGDSTIYGIEASAQARFGNLNLDVGLAYTHSELGGGQAVATYELPGSGLGVQCAAGQTTGCFDYSPYLVSLSGERNPYSPELAANFAVSYNFPLWGGTLKPQINFSYIGQQYASIFQNSNFYLLDVRQLVDGFLTYSYGDWAVELFARNLTDERYLSGISAGNNGYVGDPRTFGLRVQRKF